MKIWGNFFVCISVSNRPPLLKYTHTHTADMSDSSSEYNSYGTRNTSHFSAPSGWSGDRTYDHNTHGRTDVVVCGGSGTDRSSGSACSSCGGQGSYHL